MNWLQRLLQPARLEDRLSAELRYHFDRLVADGLRAGLPEAAARRAARLEFGGLAQVEEDCRDARGTQWVESAVADLRYAFRTLRRSPGFAFAAIATLALGIGANTAIFSVVYAVLLKPLPYARPAELVSISTYIHEMRNRFPSLPVTAKDFVEFRRDSHKLIQLAAIGPAGFNMTGAAGISAEPERIFGARVSANLFSLLGVMPERGRAFLPEEDHPGSDHVVILSHNFWMRRFAGDPAVVGRTLILDGAGYQIVGVMPAGFLFPTGKQLQPVAPLPMRDDIWKPIAFSDDETREEDSWNYGVIARLAPGASMAQAQQELDAICAAISKGFPPNMHLSLGAQLTPLKTIYSGDVRQGLLALLGAVGLLLLVACVNLANLLLARLGSRGREFATRAALGAPRWRLVRQLLTECLAISVAGAAVGLALARVGTRLLISLAPVDLATIRSASLNTPVLWFTALAALATGTAFGFLPALQTARRDLHKNLQEGSRGATAGRRSSRLRRTLVALEVALSTGLLAVAGLLLHSFVQVMNVDKGFNAERILATDLALPEKQYDQPRTTAFVRQLVENVRALPAVTAAGAVNALPLTGDYNTRMVYLESDTRKLPDRPVASYRVVTPGYFTTMQIPLLAGRFFSGNEPAPAAIVSLSLARRLWPGIAPEAVPGRRVRPGGEDVKAIPIIGVVKDVRGDGLEKEPLPTIYRPHAQEPFVNMTLVVRTARDPESLAPAVRTAIRNLDRNLPVPAMRTMRQMISFYVARRRFQMVLVVLFAALALALAVVGIYGVTSYAVTRQTQEIGLRMALGAGQGEVVRGVLGQGMRPVLLGLVAGLAAARAGAALVRGLLFGVTALDPIALGGVVLLLLAAAAAACYIPARRAARLDPVSALRAE
ncbi:MAG TPA: ABC transporter permease [Bryobacteraceae bacterium]|nr:ABC transporter permease [Bryobacteraceae bacterium]